MIPAMPDNTTNQNPWDRLVAEFDAWSAEGRIASLWWRDDDASAPGPKLDRLFEVTANTSLLLCVIPACTQQALEAVVSAVSHVSVGQHGYAHINHAPRGRGDGAWELGLHRGESAVLTDLDNGRHRLKELFGERFLSIVVPPWNHIDPALVDPIRERGYRGLSLFGPRELTQPTQKFVIANAHCDPINWKTGPRFTGEAKALEQLIAHLQARRNDAAAAEKHTGFLTHHIDLDDAGWAFCSRIAELVSDHPAARWCNALEVFEVMR